MSLPFDATLKHLAREHPQDFLSVFDRPPTLPVSLLNVDLSTVTTAADLVVGLGDPLQEIVHIDFQSSAAAHKHVDVMIYNALLFGRYRVPVHSILVLLRPQAAHSNLNGALNYSARPGHGKMEFGYEVVRVWEQPAEALLTGSIGTLPLSILGRLPEGLPRDVGLKHVVQTMIDRLQRDASPDEARKLFTAAFMLSGLRMRRELFQPILKGVHAMPVDMRDSVTYLMIMEEGAVAALRRALLHQGRKRFGEPDDAAKNALTAVTDLRRMEVLTDQLLDVNSWKELLDRLPPPVEESDEEWAAYMRKVTDGQPPEPPQ